MRQLARTLVLAVSFGGLMSGSAEAASPLEQVPSWSSRSRPLRPADIAARSYHSEGLAGGRYGALETALAASGAPQPAQDATTAPPEKTKAQLALEPIEQDFLIVYQSLQNKGGIAPDDRETIRSLRDRATAFNRKWRGEQKGLAFEMQLSVWLEAHDRVDELFERLVKINPDDPAIGLAWTNYVRRGGDNDRVEKVFKRIVKAYPEALRVRAAWADYLKASNRYGEALEALEGHDLDPTEVPGAVLTFSECLFAEQRYQEALDALEAVPAEVLAENPFLSSQIDRDKPTRQKYVEFWTEEQAIREAEAEADDLPRVELVLDRGRIVVELYENEAPNTVSNFISLVESGFYTDTKFHRVVANFMAQGGDPNTKPGATGAPGQGSPGYRIPDEHGRLNSRRHFTGSLAMAKTAPPNTAGCQFFITHTATDWINGKHTVFGHVIEGLEVARGIEQDEVLKSATVLRKRDHEYEPSTLPEEGSTTAPSTQPG